MKTKSNVSSPGVGDNGHDSSDRPEVNESNEAMIGNMIFQKLNEIRSGNAYVEHELNPDSFSKLLTDENEYSKFEIMLARNWMDVELLSEEGLNAVKKEKLYINAIKAKGDFIRNMIEQYASLNTSPEKTVGNDSVSSLSESKNSSSHKRRKKSKKRKKKKQKDKKKTRKSKKRKRDKDQSSSDESSDADMGESVSKTASLSEQGRDEHYEKRKAEFEKGKKEVLQAIPKEVKQQFRQLGFAKWGKEYLPIMFLGPFDVAPGPVRDEWFQMREKTMSNHTTMSRLVFWYGTTQDSLADAFSFIAAKNTMSYEEGRDKYLSIPSKIKTKMNKNKKLTKSEEQLVRGLEDIQKDNELPTEKRQSWLFDFEEEYEMDDDDDVDSEQEDNETKTEPEPKKTKKMKTETTEEDDAGFKKKRKRQSDPKTQESKKKSKGNRQLDKEIMEEVAEEEAFHKEDQDEPSEDDIGDDDFSVAEESDSDEEDELYEEQPKKGKKKESSNVSKPKAMKEKTFKKPKDEKMDKIRKALQAEQKSFEKCEEIFLPFIFKLNKDHTDMKYVEKYLRKVLVNVELLTPSFIQESQIGMLIKKIRKQMKEKEKMNALCKGITAKMKDVYTQKLVLVPKDFKPEVSNTFKKVMASFLNSTDHSVVASSSRKSDDHSTQESVKKGLAVSKKSSLANDRNNAAGDRTISENVNNVSNKKKSYSLMGLMSQSNQTIDTETGVGKENLKVISGNQHNEEQSLTPRWIINYKSFTEKTSEANIDRELAMDFFNAAVARLPQDKIDRASVANALEEALYTKYEGSVDTYWDRVHEICGALTGKKKIGHLAQKIINGEYATPLDVINVPQKLLFQSFEGHWIP